MPTLLLAALLAATASPQPATSAPAEMDLTAFANGALVVQSTSDFNDQWTALWLLDEDPRTGWASAKGVQGPFEIVVALPERSEIHALEFDAASVESPQRAAKVILDAVRKKKARVLVGTDAKLLDVMVRVAGPYYQQLFGPVMGRLMPKV